MENSFQNRPSHWLLNIHLYSGSGDLIVCINMISTNGMKMYTFYIICIITGTELTVSVLQLLLTPSFLQLRVHYRTAFSLHPYHVYLRFMASLYSIHGRYVVTHVVMLISVILRGSHPFTLSMNNR